MFLKSQDKVEFFAYSILILIFISSNYLGKDILSIFDTNLGIMISLIIIIFIGKYNLKISIVTGFIYLLIIVKNRKENDKESFLNTGISLSHYTDTQKKFEDQETTIDNNYCIPAGEDGCQEPYKVSENNNQWCAIPNKQNGSVRCIQKCPPTVCTKKMSIVNSENEVISSECPDGKIISQDDPQFCCSPMNGEKSCSCNPWKSNNGCPKYKNCGDTQQIEEENMDCPYVMVKQYNCPTKNTQEEETLYQEQNTIQTENCSTNQNNYINQSQKNNSKKVVPWLKNMYGNNTKDPYIDDTIKSLNKRRRITQNNSYDDFNVN